MLPRGLHATPTHALTVDDQQMLVADDYDATQYYHLAPNFQNHVYFDILDNGDSKGWTFLDIKIGTLILWWNNTLHDQSLFNGLSNNTLGYQNMDLSSNTGVAQAPLEGWFQAPDVKLSVGYAAVLNEAVNVALCVQWATLDQTRNSSTSNGSGQGGPVDPSDPLSLARYLAPNAGYYPNLTVTSFANTQSSSSLGFAPSIGITNSLFALDLKGEVIFNKIQNTHSEDVSNLTTDNMSGTVTQGLEDKNIPSWDTMGRIRFPFGEGSFVLRGSFNDDNLSTEHTEVGTFSGSGFTPDQLAGFNQVDADENYTVISWDSMMGWVQGFDKSKSLIVLGLGMNEMTVEQDDVQFAPRSGGASIQYNNLVTQSSNDNISQTLNLPFLLGGEMELSKFSRVSGVLSRNVIGNSSVKNTISDYNTSSGALASQNVTQTSSDNNDNWTLNLGLGLFVGDLNWDMAVNSGFFASNGALVNPAYQSTISWEY
jgi:hypothetical protein